jgi:hypothetical protein
MIGEGPCPYLGGNLGGPLGTGIDHADQFDIVEHGKFLGMEPTQITNPDDRRTQFPHDDYLVTLVEKLSFRG